jgi:hypothetical protein
MNRKNMQLFMEYSTEHTAKKMYKAYPILILFAMIIILGTINFGDYIYLCIFLVLAFVTMIIVPIDIKKSRANYFNVHRNAALLNILFLIEWDSIIYYAILDRFPFKLTSLLLIIFSQILIFTIITIVLKYVISQNEHGNFKKLSAIYYLFMSLSSIIIGFLPIFGTIFSLDSFILFFGTSVISTAVIYTVVRFQTQACVYKKMEKYNLS